MRCFHFNGFFASNTLSFSLFNVAPKGARNVAAQNLRATGILLLAICVVPMAVSTLTASTTGKEIQAMWNLRTFKTNIAWQTNIDDIQNSVRLFNYRELCVQVEMKYLLVVSYTSAKWLEFSKKTRFRMFEEPEAGAVLKLIECQDDSYIN